MFKRMSLSVLILAMLLFNTGVAFSQDASARETEALRQEIQELRKETQELRKEIIKLREVFAEFVALVQSETQTPTTTEAEIDSPPLRLASWNIRVFSDKSRTDEELAVICEVLGVNDFIAIVELRDQTVLDRAEQMLLEMGRDYDYLISEPVGRGVKERYAFLYDPTRVTPVSEGQIFPDPNDVFIREPYYASFRAGNFDFTVIAVHVIWGSTVKERQAELHELARVYNTVQDADADEQDVILVGDFNRNPTDAKGYGPLLEISTMIQLFQPPEKSHIKDSSLYDNIFFQVVYTSEFTGEQGIDRFDEIYFSNDDDAASRAVSDHRPVWGVFNTGVDDD